MFAFARVFQYINTLLRLTFYNNNTYRLTNSKSV